MKRHSSLLSAPGRLGARVAHIHGTSGQAVTFADSKQFAWHRPPRAASIRWGVPTCRDRALHVARAYMLVDAIGGRAAQPHLHSRMKKNTPHYDRDEKTNIVGVEYALAVTVGGAESGGAPRALTATGEARRARARAARCSKVE